MCICECLNVVYTLQAFQNISGLGKRFTKMDLIDTPDIYPTLNKFKFHQQTQKSTICRRSKKAETSWCHACSGWQRTPCSGWTRRPRRSWRRGLWPLLSAGLPRPMSSPSTLATTRTSTTACRPLRANTSAPSSLATSTSSWREGRGKSDLERMETKRRRWKSPSSALAGQLRFMVCLKLWKKLSPILWHTPASSETQDVSTFSI